MNAIRKAQVCSSARAACVFSSRLCQHMHDNTYCDPLQTELLDIVFGRKGRNRERCPVRATETWSGGQPFQWRKNMIRRRWRLWWMSPTLVGLLLGVHDLVVNRSALSILRYPPPAGGGACP